MIRINLMRGVRIGPSVKEPLFDAMQWYALGAYFTAMAVVDPRTCRVAAAMHAALFVVFTWMRAARRSGSISDPFAPSSVATDKKCHHVT